MDFFESQDRARRNTWLLVFYFLLAVTLMIVALYAVAVFAFAQTTREPGPGPAQVHWWQPELFAVVAVVMLAIIGIGSGYKTFELSAGGERVASMLGGRRINPNTTDLAERRLLNVVEEMALAAGMAVPPVFVLDRERSINAFAAGFTPDDAVIGVNRGTLEYLTRDELQGVIGHEFSHILNGDMRLNLRLIGLLHGILLIAIIGFYVLRASAFSGGSSSSRRDKNNSALPLIVLGLAAVVIGYVGLFFGRLIKAAVSRQREYLADAAAVQFTRDPSGLAGALKKIGGASQGSRLETPEAESASHMFFGSAMNFMFSGFSTHPPLVERIRHLDPQFDGQFLPVRPLTEQPQERRQTAASPPQRAGFGFGRVLGAGGERIPLDPVLVMAAIGSPDKSKLNYATNLLNSLPPQLAEAVHDAFSSRAVVFAMLLDRDPTIHSRQLAILHEHEGEATAEETSALEPLVHEQGRAAWLPLIELVQSTLRGLSPEQYDSFRASVERLVLADQKITLFEFALQRVLLLHLDRHFRRQKPPALRYHALQGVLPEVTGLLSTLAHLGHPDAAEAQHAFAQAAATLAPAGQLQIWPKAKCTLDMLRTALEKLERATPAIKKRVLHAALVSVATDGQVTVAEAELLRAVADSLDCPLPPIIAGPLANAPLASRGATGSA